MCWLYANTLPFYIKDLSIWRFCYLQCLELYSIPILRNDCMEEREETFSCRYLPKFIRYSYSSGEKLELELFLLKSEVSEKYFYDHWNCFCNGDPNQSYKRRGWRRGEKIQSCHPSQGWDCPHRANSSTDLVERVALGSDCRVYTKISWL